MINHTVVTVENIDDASDFISACDQSDEIEIGCETWGFLYDGGQRGQITIWPNGRGAICHGGNSVWGEWDSEARKLKTDCGVTYNENGEEV